MPTDTSSIILASTWKFSPDAAQDFCNYLRNCFPQITKVTYDKEPSHFVVEGNKVENEKVKMVKEMRDFVQKDLARYLNAPRIHPIETPQLVDHSDDLVQSDVNIKLDKHILDLPLDEPIAPVAEIWRSQHNQLGHNPSSHNPLLKEISDATGTEITLNVGTKEIRVSGKSAAHVQQAMDCLSNLDTAMMLTQPNPRSYSHHLFLSSAAEDLRVVPYAEHPATKMMQSLAGTEKEWDNISRMVSVVVPDLPPPGSIVPTDPKPSRYWAHYQFNGFGMDPRSVEPQPGIPRSSGSSETNKPSEPSNSSDSLSVVKSERDNLHPPVEKTPIEKAARVAEWVHHNHEAKNTYPLLIDFDEIAKPERRPTRQFEDDAERIPGLLRRKVKGAAKPVTPVTAQVGKSLLDSMDHWTVLQPQVYCTMAQKSALPTEAASGLSSRQTKLEDFWGRSRAPSKVKTANTTKKPQETTAVAKVSTVENQIATLSLQETPNPSILQARQFLASVQGNHQSLDETPRPTTTQPTQPLAGVRGNQQKNISRRRDADKTQEVFHSLRPFLTNARCFPGALKLEICFGLITLSSASTGHVDEEDSLSMEDWNNAFCARNNLRNPFCMWKKLTSSGVDADSLVDLKWSVDDTRRMFEEAPVDSEVTYEIHCKRGNSPLFVVVLDKDGTASIQRPESTLATSAIHSPQTVWDISVSLRGFLTYRRGRDVALDKAIDAFIDSIYLRPGKMLQIRCIEPADGKFAVEKILLKRSTRHRHLPLNNKTTSDLMLEVTEFYQFLVGRKRGRWNVVRGRIDLQNRTEWTTTPKKWLWFEASIVSKAIDKLLQGNSNLEMGQKTDQWDAADLLGDEVHLASAANTYDTNPVASVVHTAGLGNMLRLGKTVLSQMKIGKSVSK